MCILFHCLNQGVNCLILFSFFGLTSFLEKTRERDERRKTFVDYPLSPWYLRHVILGGEGECDLPIFPHRKLCLGEVNNTLSLVIT